MNHLYYKPSSHVSPISLLILFLITFLLGSSLSVPYLFLVQKIPFIYINLLLPIILGLILGFVTAYIAKDLKIANKYLGSIACGIGFICFNIVKWAIYIYNTFQYTDYPFLQTIKEIILSPSFFWDSICYINENNFWGLISDMPITGLLLWLIWIGEIVLIALPLFALLLERIEAPFIERDNDWAEKCTNVAIFSSFDVRSSISAIEANPAILLNEPLLPCPPSGENYVLGEVFQSKDGNDNYLLLTEYNINSKGQYMKYKRLKYLYVSKNFVNALLYNASYAETL